MGEYMEGLKNKVGYISLKIKHAERQAFNFPSLLGFPGEKSSDQEVLSLWSMEEGEVQEDMVMLNPIEERDKTIATQKETIEKLMKSQIKNNSAQVESNQK